ncbi:hypothetical protein LL270_10470 [Pseudomonas aestusnigri]|uniref:hypothetical protein n=1 Tax=Halopseudomonas aestusnigri TaxID=857252 RepID=UPI001D182AAE|nr:hypothetical protein [Halopseudomonas aestusnigri]MCC4261078.1 hypothetical protein [Halopseudomonas aestusnigri]
MQVRVSAFEMSLEADRFTRAEFIDELVARSGQPVENREFYFDKTSYPGFCVGVIITIKDQSKFCKLQSEGGKKKIVVNNLKASEKIMEFNFFVLNMENGVGVYQHYHQSAALSALSYRMKCIGDELTANELASEAVVNGPDFNKLSKAAAKKLKKACKVRVSLSQVVTQAGLQKILESYKKIKALDYVLTTFTPAVRHGTPLSGRVHKKREILYFSHPKMVQALSEEITQAIAQYKIEKGRVIVQDADGSDKSIRIVDMPGGCRN